MDDFDTDGATSGMAPAQRIRALNDMLRTTGIGGKTRLTSGLVAKGSDFVAHAVSAVVMMPGESGFDIAGSLRKTSDVPILMSQWKAASKRLRTPNGAPVNHNGLPVTAWASSIGTRARLEADGKVGAGAPGERVVAWRCSMLPQRFGSCDPSRSGSVRRGYLRRNTTLPAGDGWGLLLLRRPGLPTRLHER